MSSQIWSVTSLVKYLKNSLEHDINVQSILLKGEISNFTRHRSGHLYFSLKDNGAKMNCVMFASNAMKVKFLLKEGMQVIVSAKVSLYEPQGNLQLYVNDIQVDGIGDLYLRFEALKKRMLQDGYFDEIHKKPLPMFPMSIGVVSAKSGAAIQDVLSIISRRWPLCEVTLYPSLVQGENASVDLIRALKKADVNNHDVILLVRGGGSLEDLWCFNDEMLARTIYDMQTCIVSGVGHEVDTTLVDFVSDKRAPTPSAAAELVTPDRYEILELLHVRKKALIKNIEHQLREKRLQFHRLMKHRVFESAESFLQNDRMNLMMAIQRLSKQEILVTQKKQQFMENKKNLLNAIKQYTINEKEDLKKQVQLLDAYSPLKILERGYSIALKNNRAIRSVDDVNVNDTLMICVSDGNIRVEVKERSRSHE